MLAEVPAFQRLQRQMTAWLRDPARQPAPEAEARRLAIYRELFFNNVREFVETGYPVLKSLLPPPEWEALFEAFFAGHHSQSPYFRDISLEFRTWLESSRPALLQERPWILELLHYEWSELAADCAETLSDPECDPDGDLVAGAPGLRQALWLLAYRWPVHAFCVQNPPAAEPPAQPTCLLVYRDGDERVRELEVSPLAARLVELLQAEPGLGGREALSRLAREAGQADGGRAEEIFLSAGAGVLASLRQEGVLLGTRVAGP